MPFTIPNAVNAEDVSQAQPDSRDFESILVPAFAGTGVVSGCAVTAQGTPNMTVAVAAGQIAVGGTVASVTGGNVTITAAHATLSRFDLICVDGAGVKSAVAGTPAAAPVFPDPAGKVVLAAVRVPGNITTINSQKIVDKRVSPAATSQQLTPAGAISMFAGAAAPAGWLLCNGAAVARSTYAALFALVGTTYGAGDGSTTFNVPDIQGRVPVGLGTHVDVNALGKNDGIAVASRRTKHSHTNGLTLPTHIHSHTFTLPDHAHANSLTLPNHAHSHALTLPSHTHSNTLALPNHIHSNSFTLPTHVHNHALTLPNHTHAHSFTLPNHGHSVYDPGHDHDLNNNAGQTGGPYPPTSTPGGLGGGARSGASATGIQVQSPSSFPAIDGAVGLNGTNPAVGGSISSNATAPAIDGAVGNPTTNPALGGAVGDATSFPAVGGTVGNPTTNPALGGSVGSATSAPTITGAVGNNTTAPAITGTIGDTGVNDTPAYIVLNYIIKT